MKPLAQVRWACQKQHGSRRTRKSPTPAGSNASSGPPGCGYATEAIRGLISFAFASCGYHRAFAGAIFTNEPSWKLMERAGMRKEAHFRKARVAAELGGPWIDTVRCAVLASEWPVHPAS